MGIIKSLFLLIFIGLIASCSKDEAIDYQQPYNDHLAQKLAPSSSNVMDFMDVRSRGDFGFEWNGSVCGNGELQFMGFKYDSTGKPVAYPGELQVGNTLVPQGGKQVNYEYEKNTGDTLPQGAFMNSHKGIQLTDSKGHIIFDTSIYIPGKADLPCPLPCVNGDKCLPISTPGEGNLKTYVAVDFNPLLPENQKFETEEEVHNGQQVETSGEGEICLSGSLFNGIPAGGHISVDIIRAKYFTVEGSNGYPYRLFAYVSQTGSTRYCP